MEIFSGSLKSDSDRKRAIARLSQIPFIGQYVASLSPQIIDNYLNGSVGFIKSEMINPLVNKITLTGEDGKTETGIMLAMPFPGVSILTGNFSKIDKLNNMVNVESGPTTVFHYCFMGRCEVRTEDGQYAFMDRHTIAVETHADHRKRLDFIDEDYKGLEIAFSHDFFDEKSEEMLKLFAIDLKKMRGLKEVLIGEASDKLKAAEQDLADLLGSKDLTVPSLMTRVALIADLVEQGSYKAEGKRFFLTKGQRKIASEVHDLILQDLSIDITTERLAEQFKISPVSLNKYFKIMYGDSISRYANAYKMKVAARRLTNSATSVADIAAMVGYDNPSKFGTAFKRIYEVTPSEYRRLNS